MLLRTFSTVACTALLATASLAQAGGMEMPAQGSKKPMLSPPATARLTLAGQTLSIAYNTPSLRGRHLYGTEIVPYDKVWRTGANPATTLTTPVSLHIGTLLVPAGTYTIYTLPSRNKWMLIVNKQIGQWGTEYSEAQDLGRTEMKSHTLNTPQEVMSITFEDIKKDSAEMHIRWDTTDQSVKITTP